MIVVGLIAVAAALDTFRLASERGATALWQQPTGRDTSIELSGGPRDDEILFFVWVRLHVTGDWDLPLFSLSVNHRYSLCRGLLRLSRFSGEYFLRLALPVGEEITKSVLGVHSPSWERVSCLYSVLRRKLVLCIAGRNQSEICVNFPNISTFPPTKGNDELETTLFDEGKGAEIGELADARLIVGKISDNLMREITVKSGCSLKCGEECWGPRALECKEIPASIVKEAICEEEVCDYDWPLGFSLQGYFTISAWLSALRTEEKSSISIAASNSGGKHKSQIAVQKGPGSTFVICASDPSSACCDLSIEAGTPKLLVSISRCGNNSEVEVCLASGLHPRCTHVGMADVNFERIIGSLSRGEQIADLQAFSHTCESIEDIASRAQDKDGHLPEHQSKRALQTITHYAAFVYSGAITTSNSLFTFENTHKSTVSITITGTENIGIGPQVTLDKRSGPGSTIKATGVIVAKPSSAQIPDLSGVFTVWLTASNSLATSGTVSIVIACAAVSSQCYCPAGKFANTDLLTCSSCPTTSLSCPYAEVMGCLSSSTKSSVLPSTFKCAPCFKTTQYFDTTVGECFSCSPTCLTCTRGGIAQCLSCYPSAALTGISGISGCKCISGFYPNPTEAACAACSLLCKECANGTSSGCTECKLNAGLSGAAPATCLCNGGFTGAADSCVACSVSCSTCNGTAATACLTCKAFAQLSGASPNSCMCVSGYYMSTSGDCVVCHSYCLTCVGGASSQCSTCKAKASLVTGASPSDCACGTGYVGTPDNCALCDSTCRQCTQPGINGCSLCMYYAHLSSGTAPSSCVCDTGFSPSPSVTNCIKCHSTCASCSSYGSSLCLSCLTNAELAAASPSSCVCSAGFYPSYNSSNCLACHPTCAKCRSSSMYKCYACKPNASLVIYYFWRRYGPCKCVSGFFPNLDASNCQSCHASCLKCSGIAATQCLACRSYATLSASPGPCVCKAGYYMDASFKCSPCDGNCLTCSSGPKICTSCVNLSILSGSTCSCPAVGDTSCLGCDSSCQACSGAGPAYCTSCRPNAQPDGSAPTTCVCTDGYYPDPGPENCAPCSGFCASCSGPSVNECSSCSAHAYLELGEAPSSCKCEDGYGNSSTSSTVCDLCDVSCVTCATSGSNQCLACFLNAELADIPPCECVCSAGFYPNLDASICDPCDSTCSKCVSGLPTGCTACFANAATTGGECVCASHYFPNPTAIDCAACHAGCSECVGVNVNDCKQCPTNAELEFGLSPGRCVCSASFFTTTDASKCTACSPTCARCSALGPTKCTLCFTNAHLSNGECVCDGLYSPLPDSAHCGACHSTCNTCGGLTSSGCLSCYLNASLLSGVCTCDAGFYPSPSSANCQPCFETCKTCSTSAETDCSSCYTNATLDSSGRCVCVVRYFPNTSAKLCQICDSTCKSCLNGTSFGCTECFSNASLTGAIPADCGCNPGFFADPDASICSGCNPSCQTCSIAGASGCQTCKPGAQLSGIGPASCSCLPSFFFVASTSSCDPCHSTCLTCSGSLISQCTSCSPPFSLLSGTSPGTCDCPPSQPYNSVTKTCTACHPTCQLCSGSTLAECISCFPNAEIENLAAVGRCACKSSFYPNPSESSCAQCHVSCRECSGGSENQCTACIDLAIVNLGVCECGEDSFPNPDVTKCKMCSSLCLKCQGEGPQNCSSCRAGAVLKSTPPCECVCKAGFYPSPDVSLCLPCSPGCTSCTGPGECSGCKANAEFKDASCTCLTGYVGNPDASNCVLCPVGCLKCDATGCNQCAPGLLIVGGQCSEGCPPGYIADSRLQCEPLDLNPPVPSLTVFSDNSLLLSFDKPMNCSIASSDLSVSVVDPTNAEVDVTVSDITAQDSQSWRVSLEFEQKSLANESRAILTFLNPEKVLGLNEVPIDVSSLIGVLNGFAPAQTNITTGALLKTSAASTAAATSKGGVSAGVATSFINGNPASLISLVNQLQLITYLSMSKLPIPTDFASTLAALNVGEMMPNPLSGLFSLSINKTSQSPPKHVSDYGIGSTLFLTNAMSFFTSASAVLLSFIPIYLLSKVKIPVVAKYFGGMLPSLKWSVPLNLWLTSYLDMGVFCLLQVLNSERSFENALTGVSTVCAYFVAFAFLITPLFMLAFMYRNFNYISSRTDSDFNKRWGVLFSPFKPSTNISSFAYYPIFVIRRLVLAMTLTAAANSLALIAFLNTSIGVIVSLTQTLIYLLLFRPYEAPIDQIESIAIEGSTTLIYALASSFLLDLPPDTVSILSSIGVWTVRISIFTNVFISLARTVLSVVAVVQLYKERMKLVHTRYKLQDVVSSTTRGDVTNFSELSDSRNVAM